MLLWDRIFYLECYIYWKNLFLLSLGFCFFLGVISFQMLYLEKVVDIWSLILWVCKMQFCTCIFLFCPSSISHQDAIFKESCVSKSARANVLMQNVHSYLSLLMMYLRNLQGTQKREKNDLLFEQFGINYEKLPVIVRQGSAILKTKVILFYKTMRLICFLFWFSFLGELSLSLV